ncbi:hypothetical protein [Rossellomorea sp. NS-SX7]
MNVNTYRLIKVICLAIIAGSSLYIGAQLGEIKDHLWDLVSVTANQ